MGAPGDQFEPIASEETSELLELQHMEASLIRADLEHPGVLPVRDVHRLRYLLGFARLTTFRPGARADVTVGDELRPFRSAVVAGLRGPLREERDPLERLRHSKLALEGLAGSLEKERADLLERHANELSERELDTEAGTKVLVSIAGGGGGSGYVYIGAYERLERAGIVPAYVIGSSIGALIGLFRARAVAPVWDDYVEIARGLDRRQLFSPVSIRRRYGLPGLLSLNLAPAIGAAFRRENGEPLRISDLEIPFDAVLAGVRQRSFERLPSRYRDTEDTPARGGPLSRWSGRILSAGVPQRMWEVAMFFDPRVVKPVVVGGDDLTRGFNVVDAAGFSAAIPGVLHYDIDEADERMDGLLAELVEREEVAALVDGGVASNVPAELAWQGVQAGRLGTRNAFYLAFDCFHPKWDPAHLWLQPITQAVRLQMTRNAPFADWVLRFKRTLSPVSLVPEPAKLDAALEWGRDAIEERLPMIERFLEPVAWEA